ncbi:hypothetical protein, variant [Sphaeroforma arctica JP610]|uniref:CAP-Gly domain-containing protein n=1 Tax=Sphaeroforma arctica JP610 TaxID=667725 RepID=A0A0L0FNK6_9EUKA|nr:hypothetical protein, variant [Sphaeroforma arctica JP610]KNC78304.1 hypothetical protein, variant [Sphaeroforma arctica JP610]|eukprot:XP_014152206.1 hypothetical protein, variant [Sphaeroforma arctica JP610]
MADKDRGTDAPSYRRYIPRAATRSQSAYIRPPSATDTLRRSATVKASDGHRPGSSMEIYRAYEAEQAAEKARERSASAIGTRITTSANSSQRDTDSPHRMYSPDTYTSYARPGDRDRSADRSDAHVRSARKLRDPLDSLRDEIEGLQRARPTVGERYGHRQANSPVTVLSLEERYLQRLPHGPPATPSDAAVPRDAQTLEETQAQASAHVDTLVRSRYNSNRETVAAANGHTDGDSQGHTTADHYTDSHWRRGPDDPWKSTHTHPPNSAHTNTLKDEVMLWLDGRLKTMNMINDARDRQRQAPHAAHATQAHPRTQPYVDAPDAGAGAYVTTHAIRRSSLGAHTAHAAMIKNTGNGARDTGGDTGNHGNSIRDHGTSRPEHDDDNSPSKRMQRRHSYRRLEPSHDAYTTTHNAISRDRDRDRDRGTRTSGRAQTTTTTGGGSHAHGHSARHHTTANDTGSHSDNDSNNHTPPTHTSPQPHHSPHTHNAHQGSAGSGHGSDIDTRGVTVDPQWNSFKHDLMQGRQGQPAVDRQRQPLHIAHTHDADVNTAERRIRDRERDGRARIDADSSRFVLRDTKRDERITRQKQQGIAESMYKARANGMDTVPGNGSSAFDIDEDYYAVAADDVATRTHTSPYHEGRRSGTHAQPDRPGRRDRDKDRDRDRDKDRGRDRDRDRDRGVETGTDLDARDRQRRRDRSRQRLPQHHTRTTTTGQPMVIDPHTHQPATLPRTFSRQNSVISTTGSDNDDDDENSTNSDKNSNNDASEGNGDNHKRNRHTHGYADRREHPHTPSNHGHTSTLTDALAHMDDTLAGHRPRRDAVTRSEKAVHDATRSQSRSHSRTSSRSRSRSTSRTSSRSGAHTPSRSPARDRNSDAEDARPTQSWKAREQKVRDQRVREQVRAESAASGIVGVINVGDRVSIPSKEDGKGIVRYIGFTKFAQGTCGYE